jgi:hypothetical protein
MGRIFARSAKMKPTPLWKHDVIAVIGVATNTVMLFLVTQGILGGQANAFISNVEYVQSK